MAPRKKTYRTKKTKRTTMTATGRRRKSPTKKHFYVGDGPYAKVRYGTYATSSRIAAAKKKRQHHLVNPHVFGSPSGQKSHGFKTKRGSNVLGRGVVHSHSSSTDGEWGVKSPLVQRTAAGRLRVL